jgi:DNA-binding NtrC family response regulator
MSSRTQMSLSKVRSNSAEVPAPQVLLVDESRMGVAARRTVLKEAGCDVFTASNTVDGLEQMARQSIQVLVTEFKIAERSGLEFIRAARELNPNLGVIVLSGFTDALGLHEANTGADIVLQKNSNEVAQLLRGVKRLLNRKPVRKPVAKAKPLAKTAAVGKR